MLRFRYAEPGKSPFDQCENGFSHNPRIALREAIKIASHSGRSAHEQRVKLDLDRERAMCHLLRNTWADNCLTMKGESKHKISRKNILSIGQCSLADCMSKNRNETAAQRQQH